MFFVVMNERTAGKMKFWNENMNETEYSRKLSAAEHIDELVKISSFYKHSENFKDKHKEFASKGWQYFKSYFTDGEFVYEADISVARSKEQSVVYNIGDIKRKGKYNKKESSYSITGSPNELATSPKNGATNRNSNPSIPNSTKNVKGQYSFAGPKALTANKLELANAKQMLKDGADSETIRKETGWFKGMDGKWRFEINDKDVEFYDDVKRYIEACVEHNAVEKKMLETTELNDDLRRRYKKASNELKKPEITETTLGKLIKHDLLFEAYPELRDYKVVFTDNIDERGTYNPKTKEIAINNSVSFKNVEDCMKTVIHEVQHAIQHYEGFALGSSNVIWEHEIKNGNIPKYKNGRKMTPITAYKNTAGEIEARDVSKRLRYDDAKRESTRPDIDNKNVVFVENRKIYLSKYNEILKQAWKQKGDIVPYENESDLLDFIDKAIDDSKYKADLFIGTTTPDFAIDIANITGLPIETLNRKNIVLKSNSVRNQVKTSIKAKGNLAKIVDVICFNDAVEASADGKNIYFEKNYDDISLVVEAKFENTGNIIIVSAKENQNKYAGTSKATVQYSIPSDHNYVYTDGKASFTEERLNNLFDEHSLGDGKRAEHSNAYVGYISPEDFVSLTSNKNIRSRVEDEAYILNEDELRNETETPFLEYDPVSGEVVNHEGRHRMVALKADGIESVAVVFKPSNDSFERRMVQDISLTGQNFAGGKASGNVMVKNAIPLSEKYRTEAVAQFAKNPDADVRYSLPNIGKIQYSIASTNAATANKSLLAEAKEMLYNKKSKEFIWKITGWMLGKDNKWRFEIDDSKMEFNRNGFFTNPDVLRRHELFNKLANGTITQEEWQEYAMLNKTLRGVKKRPTVLSDFIKHQALFDAYPELKNVKVKLKKHLDNDANGSYNYLTNTIELDETRSDEAIKKTLIHEIQHAIQNIERLAEGGNKKLAKMLGLLGAYSDVKNSEKYNNLTTPEARLEFVQKHLESMFNGDSESEVMHSIYKNLYGEIEARNVSERLDMNESSRTNSFPENEGVVAFYQKDMQKYKNMLSEMGFSKHEIDNLVGVDFDERGTEESTIASNGRGKVRGGSSSYKEVRESSRRGKEENSRNSDRVNTEADSIDGSVSSLHEKGKNQYSIPDIAVGKSNTELEQLIKDGKITLDDAVNSMNDQYGTMPKGENPKVDIDVPNKVSDTRGVRRFARTALESGHLRVSSQNLTAF